MHHEPGPRGLGADITGLRLRIQEEAVVGGDHDLVEPGLRQLVDRDADALQGVVQQAERRLRIVLQMAVDIHAAQHEQLDGLGRPLFGPDEVVQPHLREAVAEPLAQHLHALVDVSHNQVPQLRYQAVVFANQRQPFACTGQQAGHADRGDARQRSEGRLKCDRHVLRQLLLQGHSQLVTQGIDEEVRHSAPALLEVRCHQAVEHIGVGQAASGGPARSFQVLGEADLKHLREPTVAGTRLLDHRIDGRVARQMVAHGLFQLALTAVQLPQAAEVEVDQLLLGLCVTG